MVDPPEGHKGSLRALSEQLLADTFPEKDPSWIQDYTDAVMRNTGRVLDGSKPLPATDLLANEDKMLDRVAPIDRRRSLPAAVVLVVSILVALALVRADDLHTLKAGEAPSTATIRIRTPRPGQSLELRVREPDGFTDGFTATGTCTVPPGYRAVIVSVAGDGSGYWLLNDGILGQCVDDGATHEWQARRVDPSWEGMSAGYPVILSVIVLRRDPAERALVDRMKGDPLKLPNPTDSVMIFVTRVGA